jgi:IclR family pca regulon transcriptional regulator
MASGRVLLGAKPDAEVCILLGRMKLKAFTSRTLVKIDAIVDAVRRARQQGYALVNGELEEGLMSVAVPIRNRNGDVIASLNSSSSATRSTVRSFCDAVVPPMHRATGEMAKIL